MIETNEVQNSKNKSYCVRLNQNILLENSEEFFVRGFVELDSKLKDCEFVFIPAFENLLSKNMLAAFSLVSVNDENCVSARLFMPCDEKIVLPCGFLLGHLEQLNIEDGFYESFETLHDNNEKLLCKIGEGAAENINVLNMFSFTHLKEDQEKEMHSIIKEFSDIFSVNKTDIGCTNLVSHDIDTGSSKPISCPVRRIPFALEEKVDGLVESLLSQDVIQASNSPWNSPIVLVAKKMETLGCV